MLDMDSLFWNFDYCSNEIGDTKQWRNVALLWCAKQRFLNGRVIKIEQRTKEIYYRIERHHSKANQIQIVQTITRRSTNCTITTISQTSRNRTDSDTYHTAYRLPNKNHTRKYRRGTSPENLISGDQKGKKLNHFNKRRPWDSSKLIWKIMIVNATYWRRN